MSQRGRQGNSQRAAQAQEEPVNEDAVSACVRFILCREGSKIPIKRAEIVKHLSNAFQLPSSKVNVVLTAANQALKRIYGYKLVQVEAKGGVQFIVVSNDKLPAVSSPLNPPENRILLNASLIHIFMSGGTIREDDLWKFLANSNVMEENDQKIKKLVTNTFTKQMYLTHDKEGEGELARYVFRWGQRASEEVSKMFILEKLAQAMEKTPEHWAEQYRIAREEQEGDAVAAT